MDEPSDDESEGERLATDLEATQAAPDDFGRYEEGVVADAEAPGEPADALFDLQRPLDASTGVGSVERPRHRSSATLLAVLALLVAATAAVLYWRTRHPDTTGEAVPLAAATPSPTSTEVPVETPLPQPTAAPAMSVPTGAPTVAPPAAAPSPRPTARPARLSPTPALRIPAASAQAPPRSRQGWLERAERDQRSAASDRRARFTVQLELACEVPSLTEAFGHDRPAGTMWLVKTSFRGQTCFRVLWGRYPTREAAESALAGAPAFFSTPRNHPMVVAAP